MLKIKQQFPGYLDLLGSGRSGGNSSDLLEKKPQFRNLYDRLKYVTAEIFIRDDFQPSSDLGYILVGDIKFKLSVMIRQLFMRIYGLGDLSIFKYFLQKYPYRHHKYYAHVIYDLSTYTDKSWHIFEYIRKTDTDMFTSLLGFRPKDANFNWLYIAFSPYEGPLSKIFEIDTHSLINLEDFSVEDSKEDLLKKWEKITRHHSFFTVKNISKIKSIFESNRSAAINGGLKYIPEDSSGFINYVFNDPTVQIYLGPGEEANEEHKKWLIDVYNSINVSSTASSIKAEIIEDYPHSSPKGF